MHACRVYMTSVKRKVPSYLIIVLLAIILFKFGAHGDGQLFQPGIVWRMRACVDEEKAKEDEEKEEEEIEEDDEEKRKMKKMKTKKKKTKKKTKKKKREEAGAKEKEEMET